MARVSILALGIAASGLVVAAAAEAHPRLTASTPANGAVVSNVKSIQLRFSEKLVPAFSGADLVMTGMPGMSGHKPMKLPVRSTVANDGRTLVLTSRNPLPSGTYKLNWRAVSRDTHRIAGNLSFRVK